MAAALPFSSSNFLDIFRCASAKVGLGLGVAFFGEWDDCFTVGFPAVLLAIFGGLFGGLFLGGVLNFFSGDVLALDAEVSSVAVTRFWVAIGTIA